MATHTLKDIFAHLNDYDWKEWVYIQKNISASATCMVINADEAELGSDNFTPRLAEEAGMIDFLSIQDLRGIADNLKARKTQASLDELCAAAMYYFENDAYPPE